MLMKLTTDLNYVYYSLQLCDSKQYPNVSLLANPTSQKVSNFLFGYVKNNFIILKIFINYPFYTKIKKDEDITVLAFIANTGGLLGLCLGLSFVSVFDDSSRVEI